jgi:hypothetical protein
MSEQDRKPQAGPAPGAVVTKRALDYACSFEDFAREKLPELKGYSVEKRSVALQSAITVATLIQMERRGAGGADLHRSVSAAFAHSVQHRHLAAIQELSNFLLNSNGAGLKASEIPSFASLTSAPDATLVGSIGAWLAHAITKKTELDPQGQKIAAAMGRSAWTSGTMIVRLLTRNS